MAERRMFAKTIVESDAFLEMPLSSQALYFHMGMIADDDGFIGGPRRLLRNIGASEDDLKILIAKRFVIPFDTGVLVVKHWKINNYLRPDRYKPTPYLEERSALFLKENQAYTLEPPKELPEEEPAALEEPAECSNSNAATDGIPAVYQAPTNGIPRLGKDRDRVRLGQYSKACEGMNDNNTARACTRVRAGAREAEDAEARLRAREAAERSIPMTGANDPKWMDDHAAIMERVFGPDWKTEQAAREKQREEMKQTLRNPEWL